jgi:hypothetical protein
MTKQKPAWQKDVDDLITACQHVGRLALELGEILARKGPAIRPERLVQIRKLLFLEREIIADKLLILGELTVLAERAAEAR